MKKNFIGVISLCTLCFILACGSSQQNARVTSVSTRASENTAGLQNKLRKNPTDVRLRVRLGMQLLQEERHEDARAQFDSALALQPGMTAAKFGRAEAKFLTGHITASINDYLDVLNATETELYTSAIAERFGAPYAIRPFTTAPGENMLARFSPDGRAIVFQSNRDGNWEIYQAAADGSQAVRLTNDPAVDEAPCFSPEGRWIAFVRSSRQGGTNAAREIYLMEAQTGAELVCLTRHRADDWSPVFSPRGDHLAFVSDRDDLRNAELFNRQSDIFLFSLADSSVTKFSQGFGDKSAPGFTPDGSTLLYINNVNGGFDIFEQSLGTAQALSLLAKNGPKGGPQVAPNGKLIVYFEKRDNNLDLFLFERGTGRIQRLTCDPAMDAFPTFSPEGNEILFTSNRDGKYQIYALDLRKPIARTELITMLNNLSEQRQAASK
ncbi:MAG: Protein TolB [bacterium]|nr:Protein TolB [bacterium]